MRLQAEGYSLGPVALLEKEWGILMSRLTHFRAKGAGGKEGKQVSIFVMSMDICLLGSVLGLYKMS